MKNKKIKIQFVPLIIIICLLYTMGFISTSLKSSNIETAFIDLLIIIGASLISVLLGMVTKRIITTRWGNYKEGIIIFNILGGILNNITAFVTNKTSITILLLLIFLILGIIIFNIYEKFLVFSSEKWEIGASLKSFLNKLLKRLNQLSEVIKTSSTGLVNKIKAYFGEEGSGKKYKKPVLISLTAIIVLTIAYNLFISYLCVTVESYSPTGEIPLRTTIMVKFSENISLFEEDIEHLVDGVHQENKEAENADTQFVKQGVKYFDINPSINGSYRLEDKNTLIFVPDKELSPSTEYKVDVITDRLKSDKYFILGESFSFNTPKFNIAGVNFFYNYDLVRNIEKEVVCEINFNSPIDIKELVKNASMDIDGDPVKIYIEPSNVPTRFYIKSKEVERRESEVAISVKISKGLSCIGGDIPLEDEYKNSTYLPETVKLKVIRAETFPVEMNTFIAVLFNRPISTSMVKKHIKIHSDDDGSIPYTVETEYCYAVLQADFKPNHSYTVKVSPGMRAKTGEELIERFKYDVYIKDLEPKVNFTSEGRVLPLKGNLDIELYTLNLDKFKIKIDKIFRNNLIYFLNNSSSSEYGKSILYKTITVDEGELNQKVPHYINLRKFNNMDYKGLFKIRVSDPEDYWKYDEQYFLCTDLGILAKQSGKDLIVKIYSIMNLSPVNDVKLKLLSYENQAIKEGLTQESGTVIFKDWRINKYKFSPYVITAEKRDDYSFLQFSSSELDSSRFNIGGEKIDDKGLKAFLTSERGVYRPGEKAFITAIVRNSNLTSPPPVDVQLYVADPADERFSIIKKKIPANGFISFELPIPSYAKTGEYYISLRLNEKISIGNTSLKVEEFIPDKIKTEIIAPIKTSAPGKPIVFTVKGTLLFGPPAANRKVKTQIKFVSRVFKHPSFLDYSFIDNEKCYAGEFFKLGESKLNDKGKKEYTADVPSSISPPSALTAKIYSEVYDTGGRPVSAIKNIHVDHYPIYIGLNVKYKNVYLKGQPVDISYVAIDPKGKYKKVDSAEILVKHKVHYTILRKKGLFRERYESESYEEIIAHEDISIDKKGHFRFLPKAPGEYTIYVYQCNGMRTSQKIYVQGPDAVSTNLETAQNLIIKFNKKRYKPGETAIVNIHSPIPGRLFFNIERGKVLLSRSMMLDNNKATVQFAIQPEYIPNVYVSAFVIRRPSAFLKNLPMTSLGIKNLELEPESRKIQLNIGSLKNIRSRDGLTVNIKSEPRTNMVLAAVDEGILQITQYKTPDPFVYFYMKRALLTRLYSIFDSILPNIRAQNLAIGGDEGEYDSSRRHINPVAAKRVKSVSLYSGVLTANDNGYVTYHFKIPDFNGKLRVMAIAARSNKFGSAYNYVTVSDPIVITPSYPRMLAPQDNVEIPVHVYNKTGRAGKFKISMDLEGPVHVKGKRAKTIYIPNKAERKIYYYCKAKNESGKAAFTITAKGNEEIGISTIELPIRPARALTTIVKNGELKSGKSVELEVPSGFIKYGQKIRFSISPQHLIKFLGAINYLVKYPYGCAEQITSTLFALMYYRDLAKFLGHFGSKAGSIDRYINAGIKRLEKMQSSNGGFSMWPGESISNDYLSNYISHFLIEAMERGFDVDEKVIKKIHKYIGALNTVKSGRLDRRNNYRWNKINMYGLYLKALIDKYDYETMEFIKQKRIDKLNYIEKCRLATTYALIGEKDTAKDILPSEFKIKYFPRALGGKFDSVTKRLSIYLAALCDINPDDNRKYSIAEEISKNMTNGHFGTTHDNVHALIALAKTFNDNSGKEIDAEIMVDGKIFKEVEGVSDVYGIDQLSGKTLTLVNKGDEKVYYNLIAEGTKLKSKVKPIDRGMDISRRYLNKNGSELNLSNVEQGQLIVSTITLETSTRDINNVVVVDLLPAGFEIENLRIRSHGQLGYDPPNNWISAYKDIRDDRLLLFTGAVKDKVEFSYTLRAVSVGRFVIPQILAEAMYDPEVKSIDEAMGSVNVVRSNE